MFSAATEAGGDPRRNEIGRVFPAQGKAALSLIFKGPLRAESNATGMAFAEITFGGLGGKQT
jgi:hypothetical protein